MYQVFYSDVYSGLSRVEDNSIDLAITSPPYWGQRDYGFEGQIGNEKSYREYIGKLISIFSLLRKKLKPKGIFFLNIGDKYLSKYGNSPLAMIPYKLAYFMFKDGWKLNDILIWYKPNHMPSSIKNRFTNSYEPIFVFSKSNSNYFNDFRKLENNYSNILKVNLQPSSYKHVAAYPEKLIMKLFGKVKIPEDSLIMDPFAGSGTTLRTVQNLNLNCKNYSAFMIENNSEYIDIIKERCSLSDKEVKSFNFEKYEYQYVEEKENAQMKFLFENIINKYEIGKNGFVKVCEDINDYYRLLSLFDEKSLKKHLMKDAVSFIGAKEFDIELIYKTSLLNNNGWIIRNLIVVEKNENWFPVFMIVDDNKEIKYKFNYKALDLKHKNGYKEKWDKFDFKGFKVLDNISNLKGTVIDVKEKYENGFPNYVIVKWNNDLITKEFVIYSEDAINKNLIIEKCKNGFEKRIKEKEALINFNKSISNYKLNVDVIESDNKKFYNGKFKTEKRINWGASPGARTSMDESFFSMQRLYDIEQPLVSDYLNYKRKLKKLSKSELTNLFPKSYRHTVGHWLRRDFGGSLPMPNDWFMLDTILNLDEDFTNYVCKTALKLQTVKHAEYKVPRDFINFSELENFKKIFK